jgi:hypothetical protein
MRTLQDGHPVPASPIDVRDSADFDRLVASASVPVIVDYGRPGAACRMVAPELQKSRRGKPARRWWSR